MRERGNINNPAALQGHLTIIGAVGNRPLWMGGLGLRSSKCPLLDVDTQTTDLSSKRTPVGLLYFTQNKKVFIVLSLLATACA